MNSFARCSETNTILLKSMTSKRNNYDRATVLHCLALRMIENIERRKYEGGEDGWRRASKFDASRARGKF